jgi:uncharacterized membrane protein
LSNLVIRKPDFAQRQTVRPHLPGCISSIIQLSNSNFPITKFLPIRVHLRKFAADFLNSYTSSDMAFLRLLVLLALIVWIGGIIFFAFVLAPTLFGVLPTTKLAGDVVNATLGKLHWMGLVSGVVFLVASLLYNWQKHVQLRPFALSHIFMVLMLTFTMISQFGITPRMRELRSSPVIMDSSAGRGEFDRLHAWSTRLEGCVLFLGLGLVILTARKESN